MSLGWSNFSLQAIFMDSSNLPLSMTGYFTPGKRSLVIDKNRGTSFIVNLGIFTSIIALRQTISSNSRSI